MHKDIIEKTISRMVKDQTRDGWLTVKGPTAFGSSIQIFPQFHKNNPLIERNATEEECISTFARALSGDVIRALAREVLETNNHSPQGQKGRPIMAWEVIIESEDGQPTLSCEEPTGDYNQAATTLMVELDTLITEIEGPVVITNVETSGLSRTDRDGYGFNLRKLSESAPYCTIRMIWR